MKIQNRYCFYLPKELAERLVEYCEENNGIKKSTVVAKALEEWLNREENKNGG